MVRLILIRHGSVPANEERRYIGRTDERLSEPGRQQVLALRNAGGLPQADAVFVSPLGRCRETAEILYPGREQTVIQDFREIDFGDYEGRNAEELLSDPASGYQAWIDSGGRLPFPHGEARADFIDRSRRGFVEMMERCRIQDGGRGGTPQTRESQAADDLFLAAVVHGGTIMSILSGLCGGDYYDYLCGNGEGYQVDIQWKENGLRGEGRETASGIENGTGRWTGSGLTKIPADLNAAGEQK